MAALESLGLRLLEVLAIEIALIRVVEEENVLCLRVNSHVVCLEIIIEVSIA